DGGIRSDQLGRTGDDRDRVALHREEAVFDPRRHDAPVGRGHAGLARGEDREHGLVTGQDADLALGGAGDDLRGLARPQLAFRRDDGDVEGHDQLFSFCSCAHFSSTSEMDPTLKKACSATWSKSPRTIASNDSIVSRSGTVEPSTPVNFLAM